MNSVREAKLTDREKVIEHITDCVRIADFQINHNWVFVRTEILKDALALLKAQEPKNPIVVQNGIDASGGWWYQCPNCKMEIEPRDNYCRTCGRAVKWK